VLTESIGGDKTLTVFQGINLQVNLSVILVVNSNFWVYTHTISGAHLRVGTMRMPETSVLPYTDTDWLDVFVGANE
jgi:hypothetical protein